MPITPVERSSTRARAAGGLRGIVLAAASLVAATVATPAAADELEDLKQTMEALQQRIEQLEAQQATRAEAEAAARAEVEAARREAEVARAEAEEAKDQPWLGIESNERPRATPVTVVTTGSDYVVGGDFPNSLKLPGTDTSLAVYGFIKADLLHNFGDRRAFPNLLFTSIIPVKGAAGSGHDGETFFGVNPSQLNVETRTPTDLGELKTHLQIDQFAGFGEENSANESSTGLRLAYGTLGPLTVGQDWTAFMDLSSYPETADFEGPNSEIFARVPQIKWADGFADGWSYALALDNPEGNFFPLDADGDGDNDTADVQTLNDDLIPDLVGNVRLDQNWGHIQLSGQVRDIGYEIDSTAVANTALASLPTKSDSETGWGLAAFGQLNDPFGLHPNDKLTVLGAYGQGIRYIIDTGLLAQQTDGGIDPTTGEFKLEDQWATMAWYQHWWSDSLRSTVVYGLVKTDPLSFTPTSHFRRSQYLVGNLFWSPWPRVNLGIEYQYGEKQQRDKRNGEAHQVQASAVFLY